MPTFTDIYYSAGKHRGFSKLLPEKATSAEVGVRFAQSTLMVQANMFATKSNNLIDWVLNEEDNLFHAQNLATLTTLGGSLDAKLSLSTLWQQQRVLQQLQVGYQYITQQSDDAKQGNPISMYVYNYLKHKFTVGLTHSLTKNLTLAWNARWQARAGNYLAFDDAAQKEVPTPYKPFWLMDVRANYQWRMLDVFVSANNLLNTTHVDFGFIPQPGFWLSGGVSVKLNADKR